MTDLKKPSPSVPSEGVSQAKASPFSLEGFTQSFAEVCAFFESCGIHSREELEARIAFFNTGAVADRRRTEQSARPTSGAGSQLNRHAPPCATVTDFAPVKAKVEEFFADKLINPPFTRDAVLNAVTLFTLETVANNTAEGVSTGPDKPEPFHLRKLLHEVGIVCQCGSVEDWTVQGIRERLRKVMYEYGLATGRVESGTAALQGDKEKQCDHDIQTGDGVSVSAVAIGGASLDNQNRADITKNSRVTESVEDLARQWLLAHAPEPLKCVNCGKPQSLGPIAGGSAWGSACERGQNGSGCCYTMTIGGEDKEPAKYAAFAQYITASQATEIAALKQKLAHQEGRTTQEYRICELVRADLAEAFKRAEESSAQLKAASSMVGKLTTERDSLLALLNTPETEDFDKAVPLEAAHQVGRWGAEHDAGKNPEDWFWLVGYLAGKALAAFKAGDMTKAKHHTISASAALRNWHAHIRSGNSAMRPGISTQKSSVAESLLSEETGQNA